MTKKDASNGQANKQAATKRAAKKSATEKAGKTPQQTSVENNLVECRASCERKSRCCCCVDELDRAYDVHRAYLEHEDNLINQRLSRTLLAHGFLIAAYVILLQAKVQGMTKPAREAAPNDVPMDVWPDDAVLRTEVGSLANVDAPPTSQSGALIELLLFADTVLVFIPLIGMAIAVLALIGVLAALLAQCLVAQNWKEWPDQTAQNSSEVKDGLRRYPGIAGGGRGGIVLLGSSEPFLLPVVLGLFWACLLWPKVGTWVVQVLT